MNCSQCGHDVVQARTYSGKRTPYLQPGPRVTLIEHGMAVQRVSFVAHECDPAEVAKYTAHQAERQRQDRSRIDGTEHLRLEALAAVDGTVCPECGVPGNLPCENLTKRKRGEFAITRWPHPMRLQAIGWDGGERRASYDAGAVVDEQATHHPEQGETP